MEFSKQICIGYMSDYTYSDYFYFYNMTDTTNEHHNYFILNHIKHTYITSPLKLMDDIFESFPKLFFDRIQKCMNLHIQIVAQLSKFYVRKKENQ